MMSRPDSPVQRGPVPVVLFLPVNPARVGPDLDTLSVAQATGPVSRSAATLLLVVEVQSPSLDTWTASPTRQAFIRDLSRKYF